MRPAKLVGLPFDGRDSHILTEHCADDAVRRVSKDTNMGNTFSFIIENRIGIDGRFPSHDGRIALLRCTDETRGNDFVFERDGGQRGCTGLNLHTLPVGQQTKMRGFKLIIALIDVLYRIFTFTVRVSHVVGIGVLGSHDNASVTQCRSAGVSDLTTHSKFLQLLQGNL